MVMSKKEYPSGSSCKLLKVRDLRLNQVAPEAEGNIFSRFISDQKAWSGEEAKTNTYTTSLLHT